MQKRQFVGPTWKSQTTTRQSFLNFRSASIILFLTLSMVILPAYGYYQGVVYPQYVSDLQTFNQQKADPWNTLWNGNFTQPSPATTVTRDTGPTTTVSSFTTHPANGAAQWGGPSGVTLTKNEPFLLQFNSVGTATGSDAGARCVPTNTTITPTPISFHQLGCESNLSLSPPATRLYAISWFIGYASSTGNLNVTVQSSLADSYGVYGTAYLHANQFSFIDPVTLTTDSANPDPTPSVTTSIAFSNTARPITQDMIYSSFVVTSKNRAAATGCHSLSSFSLTVVATTCDNGLSNIGSNNVFGAGVVGAGTSVPAQCTTPASSLICWTYSGNDDPSILSEDLTIMGVLVMWNPDCPLGFNCFNAVANSDGTATLLDRGISQTADMQSNTPIDLSVAATRQLGIFEEFSPNLAGNYYIGEQWCWYLTTNSTIPITTSSAFYNPLADPNVALATCQFANTLSSGVPAFVNSYVYIGKKSGDLLQADSGAGTDPLGGGSGLCPKTSTLYICQHAQASPTSNSVSLVLNMTGGTTQGGSNQQSYICTSASSATGITCQFGGVGNVQISVTNQNQAFSQIFPFLNTQNRYYMGFAQQPKADNSTLANGTTHSVVVGNPSFSTQVDTISSFTPAVAPTTDTGSFFGWLTKAFVANSCTALQVVTLFLANPCQALANSGQDIVNGFITALLTALGILIAGAVATVNYMLTFLRVVLNAFGAFIGWGNIGDQFFAFASGVLTFFTTGLSDGLAWLLRLILRSIDLIKILNFWVGFYLSGLLNLLANLFNIVAFIVTLGIQFTGWYSTSYVLLEVMFFIWYSCDQGLSGWYDWFETSKWMAFVSFDILERMINFGISSITWLFGRIPTLDGTTLPNLPTIAISGGPRFPGTRMEAIRDGDFGSYMGVFVGAVLLFWWMSSGLAPGVPGNSGFLALVPLFYVFFALGGLLLIVLIPFQLFSRVFGLGSNGIAPQFGFSRGNGNGKPSKFSDGGRTPTGIGKVSGTVMRRGGRFGQKFQFRPKRHDNLAARRVQKLEELAQIARQEARISQSRTARATTETQRQKTQKP